jgi:hypothetical protein
MVCLHEKGRLLPNVEKPLLWISKAQNLNCTHFSWKSRLLGLGADTRSQTGGQTWPPRTEFFCIRRLNFSPKCHVTIRHALDAAWYHFDPDMGWNCSTRILWCKPAYLHILLPRLSVECAMLDHFGSAYKWMNKQEEMFAFIFFNI